MVAPWVVLDVGPWSTADAAIGGMGVAILNYAREVGGNVHGFAIHRNGPKSYGAKGLVTVKRKPRVYSKQHKYDKHYIMAGVI